MVRFFWSQNTLEDMVGKLTGHEIGDTLHTETLFRGNTLTTKALDHMMKLIGMNYLREVLQPIIDEVMESTLDYEVDPLRLDEKKDSLQNNWKNLLALVNTVWDRIVLMAPKMPGTMSRILGVLQLQVHEKWGSGEPTVRYTVTSAFVFLRFFCAAILGPKLFGLTDALPSEKKSRTLTLVSKTIQNLSNLAVFGQKEPFMKPMNEFINDNLSKMKKYLDEVSNVNATPCDIKSFDVDAGNELAMLEWHFGNVVEKMKAAPVVDDV